ncbi:hypothetical protein ACFXTO_032211 [Malus domestica]
MYDSLKPVVLLVACMIASSLASCFLGAKSLFKGARANILHAVANASVLAGYDKLQVILLGKKYGSSGGTGNSIGFDGLNSPETEASDPTVAFKTALWFWLNNVCPVLNQGFGATIRAINGEVECDGKLPDAVQSRINYYKDYCNQLNVNPGGNLYC